MKTIDVSEFKKTGFLLLRGFFDKEQVKKVRHDAQQVFLQQMLRHGIVPSTDVNDAEYEAAAYKYFQHHVAEFMSCGKQAQHLFSLHRMSMDPGIEQVLSQLGLSFPNIAQRPVLYFNSRHLAKRESYWRAPPHQDWRSMQGSLDGIVIWAPLVDVDLSLGALKVVPGSQKCGLLAEEYTDDFGIVKQFSDEDFVSVEMKQGDAIFFSAFLVHRSGTNSTESIRWSAQFRYNNLRELTFIQRGYPHPYVYKPLQELVTPDFFPSSDVVRQVFD